MLVKYVPEFVEPLPVKPRKQNTTFKILPPVNPPLLRLDTEDNIIQLQRTKRVREQGKETPQTPASESNQRLKIDYLSCIDDMFAEL